MNVIRGLAIMVVAALALALPASAQAPRYQLVTNGTFETDVSGWTGNLVHTTLLPHSGVGNAALSFPAGGSSIAAQCIDISGIIGTWPETGGKKYLTESVWYRGAVPLPTVEVVLSFFLNTTCGTSSGGGAVDTKTAADTWQNLSRTVEIPANTKSVRIQLAARRPAGGASTAYWDDVQLFSSTPNAITLREFGVSDRSRLPSVALMMALVGLTLMVGRRRRIGSGAK